MYVLTFGGPTQMPEHAQSLIKMVDRKNKICTVLCAGGEEERLGNFAPTIAVSGLNGCLVFGAGVQVSDGFSPALFQLVGGCRVKQKFCPIVIPLKYENHK